LDSADYYIGMGEWVGVEMKTKRSEYTVENLANEITKAFHLKGLRLDRICKWDGKCFNWIKKNRRKK